MLQLPPTLRDLLTLAARLLLGVVLLAHGYQKLVGQGLGATSAGFARLGVPLPGLSAAFAGCVETDTITVATSVPGGLPRRVRAADLPPASAVRPYA